MTEGLLGLWERIEALREEDVPQVLQELGQVISTPLPQLLRPEFVRDACSFLHHEKDKALLDKLRFLTTREVFENEVLCALRILAKDDAELGGLPALAEIKRACRHVRVDMVESAMQFFQSKVIAKQSFTNKVMFLTREQQVERNEIEEALDRLGEVSVVGAGVDTATAPVVVAATAPVVAAAAAATATAAPTTPSTPTPPTTDPRSKLDQALAFLSTVTNLAQGQQFLLKQGYSPQDAEEAVQVKRVCDFINQPNANAGAASPPLEAKVRFLLSKGVAQSHVDSALRVLGKSANPKVQRAIDFLSSAQTQSLPQADKTAFLQKQGLSEAEIAQALALVGKRSGIKLNPTNAAAAAPSPPAKFAPSLLEMSQTLLLKLAPTSEQYQAERAAFLAVLLFHEQDVVLRLVRDRNAPAANRGWSAQLQAHLSQWSKQRALTTTSSEAEFDWLKQTSRLAATSPEYLDLLEALTLNQSTDAQAQIEVDFVLSRALHWGFACQLSVQRLESLPRSAVCVAALLRGFTDFGSGLASKQIQQQLKSELNLSANTNGVSFVYAGESWAELDTCWEHVCALLFAGCIPATLDEERATILVRSTAFRLTSAVASMLTKVAGDKQRAALNSRVLELGEKLFDAVRGNEYVATQFAKRVVLAEEQGPNLVRAYQTVYLVFVVLVEFAVDLDNPVPQWNLISHFAFARVQSDEAVRLVDLLNLVVAGGESEAQALEQLCAHVADAYLSSSFSGKDFVLGAKIDYLLQTVTASRFAQWWSSSDAFAKWLLFGCGHEFGYLARDCNVLMTDAIRAACGSAAAADPPALQLALVPAYMQALAEADGLDAQVLGFSVGSVFTSLGASASPRAPALACLAYFKLMDRAETRHALSFMALKAVALPSLSLCLDRVEEWLNREAFRAMQLGADVRPVNESLYGVISRIEDAPRRGLLMVWFLSHVHDWNAVAKL